MTDPLRQAAEHKPGPWHVLRDTYRGKYVFVVARLAGPRGRVEYLLSERTGHKKRFFLADIAQRSADEENAAIAAATGGQPA